MAKAYYTIKRNAVTGELVQVTATSGARMEYDTGCLKCEHGAWRGCDAGCTARENARETKVTRNIKLIREVMDRKPIKGTHRVHWRGRWGDYQAVVELAKARKL